MIREKVYEILDLQEKIRLNSEESRKIRQKFVELQESNSKILSQQNILKQSLGKIIAPIAQERKNIVIEKDGKHYTIFYDRKLETAHINECLTDKEADIKLALDKLTQGVKNEK